MPLASIPPRHHTKYGGHNLLTEANAARPPVAIINHNHHARYGRMLAHILPRVTREVMNLISTPYHHNVKHEVMIY